MMRAEAFFAAAAALPRRELADVVRDGIVVVAPHPDDESLGCGGLIAEARRLGHPVGLVVVSDGAGSHPNSRAYPRERLIALREAETLAAAALLGLATEDVTFLRLPDRSVPADGPVAAAAAAAIVEIARDIAADAIFTSWGHDPHCDHAAAAAIARLAVEALPGCRLFSFPVWGWTLPGEAEIAASPPAGFRLDVSRHRDSKRAAVAAHRSQTTGLIADDPDGFRLPAAMIDRLVEGDEVFVDEAASPALAGDEFVPPALERAEDRLGAGAPPR